MIMGNLVFSDLVLIFVVLTVFSVLYVFPIWQILKRVGYNPTWSLLAIVPFGKIIGLYILAFKRWPNQENPAKQM
jgi:hypothetical protein